MSGAFDNDKPLFMQIRDKIEDQIVNGQLKEHDQIPSTNQLVQFYKINHITVSKGIQLLEDSGIVYKKRGLGVFVAEGAKEKLLKQRQSSFAEQYVYPMLMEAGKLGISNEDIYEMIKNAKEVIERDNGRNV
ncbi:GntR family transcriptional regulator [Paenibacillus sp. DYY-L-2]|uniref:GntR family transcriptional regulator n=1 Tax=Paenibacillus sp. DYY-L-2 TaxID=3447013 RepID=UPI003F506C83